MANVQNPHHEYFVQWRKCQGAVPKPGVESVLLEANKAGAKVTRQKNLLFTGIQQNNSGTLLLFYEGGPYNNRDTHLPSNCYHQLFLMSRHHCYVYCFVRGALF